MTMTMTMISISTVIQITATCSLSPCPQTACVGKIGPCRYCCESVKTEIIMNCTKPPLSSCIGDGCRLSTRRQMLLRYERAGCRQTCTFSVDQVRQSVSQSVVRATNAADLVSAIRRCRHYRLTRTECCVPGFLPAIARDIHVGQIIRRRRHKRQGPTLTAWKIVVLGARSESDPVKDDPQETVRSDQSAGRRVAAC
jgi:hypothetical protein